MMGRKEGNEGKERQGRELASYLIDTIKIVNSKSAIVSARVAYAFITMSVTAIYTNMHTRGIYVPRLRNLTMIKLCLITRGNKM